MKRILTLLAMGFLFLQAQAQVLFQQDFEAGSIAPMKAWDIDGKTLDQNVGNLGPTWAVFSTSSTNRQALSTSWFAPIGMCDDWLISPPLEITQANTFLIWEASAYGAAPYQDGYEVRISTTGDTAVTNFTDVVFSIAAESNDVQRRAINLDAYIGQTIHFAFRNNSFDKYILFLDNLLVRVQPDADIIVKDVVFEKYNRINGEVPVTVVVENNGASPLNSFDFTWTVGATTYTDNITGFNLGVAQTKSIIHNFVYFVGAAGEFPMTVDVSNPNGAVDFDTVNNVGYRTVYGLSEQLPKKVVVEEGTGTWCGWCPRGFVAMDKLPGQFPGIVLPVAVHNFDPMTDTEYDDAFSQTIGGYPSGHVDRKDVDIDPDDPGGEHYGFDDAVAKYQNRRVPVQLDVQTEYNEQTRMVNIHAIGQISIATLANNFRFACVITEDHVTGTSADYDQVNYYAGGQNGVMGGFELLPNPVPAEQMVYDFVARAILGGFYGMENSISPVLDAHEFFEVNFSYQVPAGYDITEMKAIVIILDDETGEILNADDAPVSGSVAVPLVPAGQSNLYPNPAVDFVNLTVDFQTADAVNMRIYTTHGVLVQDLGTLNLADGKAFEKINVADFKPGMYLLELRHKNSVTALPFTKL